MATKKHFEIGIKFRSWWRVYIYYKFNWCKFWVPYWTKYINICPCRITGVTRGTTTYNFKNNFTGKLN